MSVKEIDAATFYQNKPSTKKELFLTDIKEILEKRIEYCELENFPYSKNTQLNDVIHYAQNFLAGEFYKETGKRVKKDDMPFAMTKWTDHEGKHILCAFYVNVWDRMIKDAKGDNAS